jgi:hypothetical protein
VASSISKLSVRKFGAELPPLSPAAVFSMWPLPDGNAHAEGRDRGSFAKRDNCSISVKTPIAHSGHVHSAFFLACLAFLPLSANLRLAQNQVPGPDQGRLTLSEVVDKLTEKNAERAGALEGYRGRRFYQVDYNGFPSNMHAEMIVGMRYSAPASQEFTVVSQSGSKWLINHVIKRLLETERESSKDANRASVQITEENYDFTQLEWQDAADGCSYVLAVQPKKPNKFLFRGRIWVNDKDFAVCRIEGEPAVNPSFWIRKTVIHHSFVKVGDFWLPAENQSVSQIRLGGRATLIIKYQDYEIQARRALKTTDVGPILNQ